MIYKADKLELMLENVMTGCINQLCPCRETAFHRDHFFFFMAASNARPHVASFFMAVA